MPRKFFKRLLPHHHTIRDHKHLRLFGTLLHNSNLWHLNRQSVARAVAIGFFVAFLPIPFQMVLAAGLAIVLRANLPLSVILVWVSNPITFAPIFYLAYKVGSLIIVAPEKVEAVAFSWQTFTNGLGNIWQPLLIGSFICGLVSAVLGHLLIQFAWRMLVIRKWRNRAKRVRAC